MACFCSERDLLSQWRGYPSPKGGCAIGFDAGSMGSIGMLRRVVYDEGEQVEKVISLLAPLCNALVGKGQGDAQALLDLSVNEHLGHLGANLAECAYCFKHPSFSEESEWRLVYIARKGSSAAPGVLPVRCRVVSDQLLPYVAPALPPKLPGRPIAEVVIGPNPHRGLAEKAARYALAGQGYDDLDALVKHSAIPLRA